jgi:hypothetical protein
LQHDELLLVGIVVVEPAGTHDRVRQAAGAHEPLAAPLPVVSGGVLGNADRGHQRDPRLTGSEGTEHVADRAVVDLLGGVGPAVRAVGEHDPVYALDSLGEGALLGQVAGDYLGAGRQRAGPAGVTDQRAFAPVDPLVRRSGPRPVSSAASAATTAGLGRD